MAYTSIGNFWTDIIPGLKQFALSPEDVRRSKIASEVTRLRSLNWSDEKIIAYLNEASEKSALSVNHPCAGPKGENICTGDDLRIGFEMAAASEQRWKSQVTKSTFIKIGGLLVIGYVAYRIIGSKLK